MRYAPACRLAYSDEVAVPYPYPYPSRSPTWLATTTGMHSAATAE